MEQPDSTTPHLENLREIRTLMEKSSRFISLSGFSGIFVGIFALLGEYVAMYFFKVRLIEEGMYSDRLHEFSIYGFDSASSFILGYHTGIAPDFLYFFADAIVVLGLSISAAVLLSWRKARKNNVRIWDASAKRLLINLFLPLLAGGIFCLALLYQHFYAFIIPSTLIFYGIALFNAGKYTLNDIRALGVIEIVLGLIVCFFLQYSFILWGIGFGLLHIIYGIAMYYKYER